jgi:hypothetical protein
MSSGVSYLVAKVRTDDIVIKVSTEVVESEEECNALRNTRDRMLLKSFAGASRASLRRARSIEVLVPLLSSFVYEAGENWTLLKFEDGAKLAKHACMVKFGAEAAMFRHFLGASTLEPVPPGDPVPEPEVEISARVPKDIMDKTTNYDLCPGLRWDIGFAKRAGGFATTAKCGGCDCDIVPGELRWRHWHWNGTWGRTTNGSGCFHVACLPPAQKKRIMKKGGGLHRVPGYSSLKMEARLLVDHS